MGAEFCFSVAALDLLQWAKVVIVTILRSTVITPEVWVKLYVRLKERAEYWSMVGGKNSSLTQVNVCMQMDYHVSNMH